MFPKFDLCCQKRPLSVWMRRMLIISSIQNVTAKVLTDTQKRTPNSTVCLFKFAIHLFRTHFKILAPTFRSMWGSISYLLEPYTYSHRLRCSCETHLMVPHTFLDKEMDFLEWWPSGCRMYYIQLSIESVKKQLKTHLLRYLLYWGF